VWSRIPGWWPRDRACNVVYVPSSPTTGAWTGFWPPKRPLTKSAIVSMRHNQGAYVEIWREVVWRISARFHVPGTDLILQRLARMWRGIWASYPRASSGFALESGAAYCEILVGCFGISYFGTLVCQIAHLKWLCPYSTLVRTGTLPCGSSISSPIAFRVTKLSAASHVSARSTQRRILTSQPSRHCK